MGTFARLFQKAGTGIPDDKKEEFKRRVEKLFQAGGMMELERVELCGRKVITIRKASMHNYGMDFYYNYFEDDCWENAGFSLKDNSVWSGKIGWREYNHVVVAAYTLEALYTNGPAAAWEDWAGLIASPVYTGWINYVFHEQFAAKNSDPWALFEAVHDQLDADLADSQQFDWEGFVQDIIGVIGYYEIRAVLSGTDAADQEFHNVVHGAKEHDDDSGMNFFDCIKRLKMAVRQYHEESRQDETEQLSFIMEMLLLYYEQESASLSISKKYEDKNLEAIRFFMALSDAPAYAVKVIAETYNADFWELWGKLKGLAGRRLLLYPQEAAQKAVPVSTMDFLGIASDDMILFWGDDEEIHFSEELKNWFAVLKSRYNDIVKDDVVVENPLYWILDIMQYADENYYCIYTFADFLNETIEHLNDKHFLALWRIYDEMLHDPELEEAGSVVFVPEGPEYENVGLYYIGEQPRRRLKKSWDIMKKEEKNNRARVTFRRYMALVENKRLRKEIFGF